MPRLGELQKAFAIATKCSEDPSISLRERNYFRAIASLIYQGCGASPEALNGSAAAAKPERTTRYQAHVAAIAQLHEAVSILEALCNSAAQAHCHDCGRRLIDECQCAWLFSEVK